MTTSLSAFSFFKICNGRVSLKSLHTKLVDLCTHVEINMFKPILIDRLPHLFHGFRNKYFNKISFGNMLYFHNYLYMFCRNAWFFDIYAMKNNHQNNMQLTYFFLASNNIPCDRVQVIFLFVHVILTYESIIFVH